MRALGARFPVAGSRPTHFDLNGSHLVVCLSYLPLPSPRSALTEEKLAGQFPVDPVGQDLVVPGVAVWQKLAGQFRQSCSSGLCRAIVFRVVVVVVRKLSAAKAALVEERLFQV